MQEKSFSYVIKKEIISKKLSKEEQLNFLSGIFDTSKVVNNVSYIIMNEKENLEYIENLINKFELKFEKNRSNSLAINLDTFKNDKLIKQQAYFSAIFFNSGSISNKSSSSYHLELKFYDLQKANEVINIMSNYDINFKILKRKNIYVLYIKKIENICDFLRAIEAFDSYLKFEETKIERDFNNNVNRLTNFDFYNQEKIASINNDFLNNYDFIKRTNNLDMFSDVELKFYELKFNNLDLSLNDLVKALEKSKIYRTKSSLSRYLEKLDNFVKKIVIKNSK